MTRGQAPFLTLVIYQVVLVAIGFLARQRTHEGRRWREALVTWCTSLRSGGPDPGLFRVRLWRDRIGVAPQL